MNPRRDMNARSATSAFSESSDGLWRWVSLTPPCRSQSRWIVRNAYLSVVNPMRPPLGSRPGRRDQCAHVAPSAGTFQQLSGADLFRTISSTRKTDPYGTATRPFREASGFNPLYIGSGLVQTLLSGMLGRTTFPHTRASFRPSTPDRNLWLNETAILSVARGLV